MYRWQNSALVLLSIGGVISMTFASAFHVLSIPLVTVDVGGYCDGLERQLGTQGSPIIVLQVGRPSAVYEIIAGANATSTKPSSCEFLESDSNPIEEDTVVKDFIVQQIEDGVITVKRHRIVEYITVITTDGEYLLTLERTGDLEEPLTIVPKFGGASAKEKLLLSLVGGGSGGRIKSYEPLKKA